MEIRKNNKINIYVVCNWEFITMTDFPLPLYGDGSQHRGKNMSYFQSSGHDKTARPILPSEGR